MARMNFFSTTFIALTIKTMTAVILIITLAISAVYALKKPEPQIIKTNHTDKPIRKIITKVPVNKKSMRKIVSFRDVNRMVNESIKRDISIVTDHHHRTQKFNRDVSVIMYQKLRSRANPQLYTKARQQSSWPSASIQVGKHGEHIVQLDNTTGNIELDDLYKSSLQEALLRSSDHK